MILVIQDKINFIDYLYKEQILQFGEFRLKSGRISPYFFNTGLFNTGESLGILGYYYAKELTTSIVLPCMLFGPAYKGIPLVCSTAIALSNKFGITLQYSFNRKEEKDHGEGGSIVGSELKGRVVVLDDVITSGSSIQESIDIIEGNNAEPYMVLLAFDRQEYMIDSDLSATKYLEEKYDIPVRSLICLNDVIDYVKNVDKEQCDKILQYREKYGV